MTQTIESFQLNNRLALITGGAGFLARFHAEAILEGGGQVILVDIDKEGLEKQVKNLEKDYSKKVFSKVADITNEAAVKDLAQTIEREITAVAILINNATRSSHMSNIEGGVGTYRVETFSIDTWEKDLAVSLTGAFLMSKYFGERMVKNGGGVIINIASDLGVIAPDQRLYQKEGLLDEEQAVKPVTYSVTKHGLLGLTKYFATYWPHKKVRVNAVSFGGVRKAQSDVFLEKVSKLIPLGRMAEPGEYKGTILFLSSDASSYMTGANVVVDGGRTVW